jgi:hypothetical protein
VLLPWRGGGIGKTVANQIIDKPHLKSKIRLCTETALTIGLWGAFAYCLLPTIRALLALLCPGVATVPVVLGSLHGTIWDLLGGGASPAKAQTVMGLVFSTGQIALAVLSLYSLWICYNYLTLRFKRPGEALRLLRGARGLDESGGAPERSRRRTINMQKAKAAPGETVAPGVATATGAGAAAETVTREAADGAATVLAASAPVVTRRRVGRPPKSMKVRPQAAEAGVDPAAVFVPAPQPVNGRAVQ